MRRCRCVAVALAAGLFPVILLGADTARTRNGLRREGDLTAASGRLRFTCTDSSEAFSARALESVRLGRTRGALLRAGGGCRVYLPDGQHVSGVLLGLDTRSLQLRTAWSQRLEIPRAAVVAITALPGWRLRFADDFDRGLKRWTTRGEPTVADGTVVFDRDRQEMTHRLQRPLAAGRVGVNFEEKQAPTRRRFEVQAIFGEGTPARTLTVILPRDHAVKAPQGISGEENAVPPTLGAHRLVVQFTSGTLRVLLDDTALWHTLESGPPGPLCEVRLRCVAADGAGTSSGALAWSAFTIEEAVDEGPLPPGDPEQDEVVLDRGDQLFGHIVEADRRSVRLEGKFGVRDLPWPSVRACRLRRVARPAKPLGEGDRVRLLLDSGLTSDRDLLEGEIVSLGREVVLQHALLGELRLPRWAVYEVRSRAQDD